MAKRLLKWFIVLTFVAGALGLAGVAGVFWYFGRDLPTLMERDDFDPPQISRVYSAEGEIIAEYFTPGAKRTVVPLEKIPEHVRYAFMAAEDADFMRHEGIDYLGLVRAFYYALRYDTGIKGTSTITQQVIKNLMLTPERAIERKVKEIILARQIEQHLSKEDILYLYLNTIYLGHGVNGVEEASRLYFGKGVGELSLVEAATLAGLTQSPETKTPFRHPEEAAKRRAFVLRQLWEKGFIEEARYREVVDVTPELADRARSEPYLWSAPFFTEHVRKILVAKYGDEVVQGGGLRVHTTLRVNAQKYADDAVREGLAEYDDRKNYYRPQRRIADAKIDDFIKTKTAEYDKKGIRQHGLYDAVVTSVDAKSETVRVRVGKEDAVLLLLPRLRIFGGKECTEETLKEALSRGDVLKVQVESLAVDGAPMKVRFVPGPEVALVAIDPTNRQVISMVGGYDFETNKFDHATQAQRQTGSTFKPFVYAAALESKAVTPATILLDSPAVFPLDGGKTWSPKNADGSWRGPIRVREGLAASRNVVAVRVLQEVGIDAAIAFSRKVGISSALVDNFTMVMGSSELRPLEITNAYATFASGGMVGDPVFITKVETNRGGTELFHSEIKRGISEQVAYLITFMMQSVVHGYTDANGTRRGGTASSVRVDAHTIAGKTGTTNEAKDAWFIGFTPEIVAGVWVGFDNNTSLGAKEYGGRVAAPIWKNYMAAMLRGREPRPFVRPETGLTQVMIDPKSGKLARTGGIEETFLTGTQPTEYADEIGGVGSAEDNFLLNQFD